MVFSKAATKSDFKKKRKSSDCVDAGRQGQNQGDNQEARAMVKSQSDPESSGGGKTSDGFCCVFQSTAWQAVSGKGW